MTPGKKALITGGSSPLAIALGKLLFEKGYTLYVTSKNPHLLSQVKKAFPCNLLAADLTTDEGRQLIRAWILKEGFDLVVNSAGMGFYGNVLDQSLEDIENLCQLNMIALVDLCKQAAHTMIDHGKEGVILNISSAVDKIVFPTFAVYAASKSFVTHFSLAFAQEVKSQKISILTASCGQIKTHFQERASKGYYASHAKGISPEKGASFLLWQIENLIPYYVFPKKVAIMRFILNFILPKKMKYFLLKRSIKERIAK